MRRRYRTTPRPLAMAAGVGGEPGEAGAGAGEGAMYDGGAESADGGDEGATAADEGATAADEPAAGATRMTAGRVATHATMAVAVSRATKARGRFGCAPRRNHSGMPQLYL